MSSEMRRFSAGIRIVVALLCTLLLISAEPTLGTTMMVLLAAYDLLAGLILWAEATGRTAGRALAHYWIDVTWSVLMLHLTSQGTGMLLLTFVQPVVLASIGYGVRHGVVLALFAACGVLLDADSSLWSGLAAGHMRAAATLGVLALLLASAVLSRPMSVLRQRLMLVSDLEAQLDPRRGLDAICATLIEGLRKGTGADTATLVLPACSAGAAFVSTADEGDFRMNALTHARVEALLEGLPPCPVTHVLRRWPLFGGTRLHGSPRRPGLVLDARLDELSRLLEVRTLVVVPLQRAERRLGHIVLGLHERRARAQEVAALADAAPELYRIVEQAALVDRLQDESAAHERVRIGRDLHDSAIQPYLGLKYAVESVARRIAPDNPVRPEIDGLLNLINSEVAELREIISGLRSGEPRGDNSLIPAVRRQVRRFSMLFGIDVQLDGPDEMHTSRALAGALFHMVNEAINNVRKHTPARRVWIRLEQGEAYINMMVRDDAGEVLGRPVNDFTPRSLSERAAALGGFLHVTRPDALHTELFISVPFETSSRY
jgi:signal transduction histidine kinase